MSKYRQIDTDDDSHIVVNIKLKDKEMKMSVTD